MDRERERERERERDMDRERERKKEGEKEEKRNRENNIMMSIWYKKDKDNYIHKKHILVRIRFACHPEKQSSKSDRQTNIAKQIWCVFYKGSSFF